MQLLIWIINHLTANYNGANYDYFTGHFTRQQVQKMQVAIEKQDKVEISHSHRVTWYQWVKESKNEWYEMRIDFPKYKGDKCKVIVWRYNALERLLENLAD